jgi:hypothetical protein
MRGNDHESADDTANNTSLPVKIQEVNTVLLLLRQELITVHRLLTAFLYPSGHPESYSVTEPAQDRLHYIQEQYGKETTPRTS